MYKEYKPNPNTQSEYPEIKIKIIFNKGGFSYLTSKKERKGYYAHFNAVKREKHESGMNSETYMGYSGFKVLLVELEPNQRKTVKRLTLAKEILAKSIDFYVNTFKPKENESNEDQSKDS